MTDIVPATRAGTPEPATPRPPDPSDELARRVQRLRELTDQAHHATQDDAPGTDLVATAAGASPQTVKAALAARRTDLDRQMREIADARAQVQQWLDAELARAEAVLRPLQEVVQRLEEGIMTVNLYLGRDEHIVTLADGDPAPADTPITVRQMVLSMDEETTIAAAQGGIDYRDLDQVDRWITSDPAHLDQLLPEPRGVVVLVPRRRGRDYGNIFVTTGANAENRRSFWLIRNGDRLYRMTTKFDVGERLTPTRDEFEQFFTRPRYNPDTRRDERVPLEPGGTEWMQAEAKADQRRRHFMRAMLIVQGLIDRTVVFHPLPAPTVSVLQPDSYDAGHVRLVGDAETSLTAGRTPFHQWLTERNRLLRPGMRIVGAFDGERFRSLRQEGNQFRHTRLHPTTASRPVAGEIYPVEERRPDGGLVFRYRRTDTVWTRSRYTDDHGPAKTRASCVIYPDDQFVIPLDLVTVEEMRDYLSARSERHAYLDMLPLLTAAIEAKTTEHAAEAPFRELLAAQLAATHHIDPGQARAAVPDLVDWWKFTATHHRPLVHGEDPAAEAHALRAILAEYDARRQAAAQAERDADADAAMLDRLREHVPDAILVARTRDGGYIALAPQHRAHPASIARPDAHLREYTTGKTGKRIVERTWVTVDAARAARWRVLWSDPAWQQWNLTRDAAATLTDPEIDSLIEHALHAARHHEGRYGGFHSDPEPSGTPVAITHSPRGPGRGTLSVYLDPGHPITIPNRLLTATIPEAEMRVLTVEWHRGHAAAVVHQPDRHAHTVAWSRPRLRSTTEAPEAPWRNQTPIWSDPVLLADSRGRAQAAHDARERAAALGSLVDTAARAVREAWTNTAVRAARERFMADYGDPQRWEGHLKTLRINYPHYGHKGLDTLLRRLVEDGHDLTGHTVSTAAELLAPESFALPDDVTDLPITPTDDQRHGATT